MHEGAVSTLLGLAGIPSISESTMIERDAAIARYEGGAHPHAAPVSAAESVAAVERAQGRRASQVTAEVTPHHLTLTDEAVRSLDPRFKMNPPLRAERDREALIDGPALGRDRLHRDRPRAALARGEGGAVRAGADGRHRPRDGVRGPLHGPRAARACSTLDLLVERMTRRRRVRTGCRRPRSRRARRANLCLVDLDAAWTVGEAGYESRSENSLLRGPRAARAGC